jgi:hypothetical protein
MVPLHRSRPDQGNGGNRERDSGRGNRRTETAERERESSFGSHFPSRSRFCRSALPDSLVPFPTPAVECPCIPAALASRCSFGAYSIAKP